MAKAKKKDVSGADNFKKYAEDMTEKSPDGKFSTYKDTPGEGLDGHITQQERGEPKKDSK